MPVYNVGEWVTDSINSILLQTYSNFEFIIVNDGSTDNTAELVRNFRDDRIVFVDNPANRGNYVRRNEGCRQARGKYIAVMDGDDMAFSERFERQIEIMEADSSLTALGSSFLMSNGRIFNKPCGYERLKILLLFNNMFLHPSLMIRKCAFERVGDYDERYVFSSDYDLACKLSLIGKIDNMNDVLMRYRLHSTQISSAYRAQQAELANQIRLNYLDRCGFQLSQEEQRQFTLMMSGSSTVKDSQEIDFASLVSKLKTQNYHSRHFQQDIFDRFLLKMTTNR